MITALVHLLIGILIFGLLLTVLAWVVENVLGCPIPMIAKQAIGIIVLLIVLLYLLHIFGVA